MPVEIIDVEQGTDAWRMCRLGLPTASMFATVLAKGKTAGTASLTRAKYMRDLAGERITGDLMESYSNSHIERGKVMEAEARSLYAFMADADPQQVGFIRNGPKGCSPDSLIGDDGMLEIKTALPHILIEKIEKDDKLDGNGDFPPEHKAQCQGALWVAEREWIDIAIYWPKLPLFVKRAYRDNGYIANLAGAVDQFNEELHELVERVRRYGAPPAAIPSDLLMAG